MAKINLSTVISFIGANVNFQKIATELNNKVLYRKNPDGEPNNMESPLDMNGQHIFNLPAPSDLNEPVRLQDIVNISAEGVGAAVLRNDLANTSDSSKGDALIGVKLSPTGSIARTQDSKNEEALTVQDFGADPTGVSDSSSAFNAFWVYIKTQLLTSYVSSLPFCTKKFTIPPGTYKVTSSINWTALQAWNVEIDANGAVIVGEVNGKSIIDMIGCRGVHINGLTVTSTAVFTPKSGILIGPVSTNTCGNNKFHDVKILGTFSIAALHNIGSETTRYDMCYFMNRVGYHYAADGLNKLGAVSDYATLRSSNVAVSFTNNSFASCRFENADTTGSTPNSGYLEGTNGWDFDTGCYHLSFQGANWLIVDATGVFRTTALHLRGLFETTQAPGVEYIIRFQTPDGTNTALDGLQLEATTTHAKTSFIRVETPAGANLTTGGVNLRNSKLRIDSSLGTATKIFDGGRISFNGEINCRTSTLINVVDLVSGYGEIFTDNGSTIPSTAGNLQVTFVVHATGTLSNQGMRFQLGNGSSVGFQSGLHPVIRSISVNADADLRLQAQGAGLVNFLSGVTGTSAGFTSLSISGVPVVTTTGAQTLTNKTLTTPTINGATISGTWAGAATYSGAIAFTSTITPSQTAGIVGTTTNNNANAGSVGEFVTASATGIAMTTATSTNITSISLTAGDWDVQGTISFNPAATTVTNAYTTSISTTSATVGTLGQFTSVLSNVPAGFGSPNQPSPTTRLSLSATTTVYLVGRPVFTTSTMTADGVIRARRVR